jgi:hypothetical protein
VDLLVEVGTILCHATMSRDECDLIRENPVNVGLIGM